MSQGQYGITQQDSVSKATKPTLQMFNAALTHAFLIPPHLPTKVGETEPT